MEIQKAKFVGRQDDARTHEMGIREGFKYEIRIMQPNFILRLQGVKLLAHVKVGSIVHQIPYSSRERFLDNWKIYAKGGAVRV